MIERTLARWARKVKENAGNICEACGQDGSGDHGRLESHHIIQVRDNPLLKCETDNGICLCHYCHLCAHGGNFDPFKLNATYWFWNDTGPKSYEEIVTVQERIKDLAHDRKLGKVEIIPDKR